MKDVQSGGCQCGRIRYEVSGEPLKVFACHCHICQKQSGSAFGMVAVYSIEAFKVTQGELSSFVRSGRAQSVRNSFCPDCGTRITHHWFNDEGEYPVISIKPGTLDNTDWVRPGGHIWTQSAQPWITFAHDEVIYDTQPSNMNELPDWKK